MQCPGQDSRYWDGEAIFESRCPKCGTIVEFFKDDSKRRCRQCGHELLNPRIDFGCASYCPFAEQCLGSLPPEMLAQKQDLLIERVALEIKRRYSDDFQKIGQASRAARFAESLAKSEEANKAAVVLAAYLAGIDAATADRGERETAAAKAILEELKANEGLSDEVCDLIRHLDQTSGAEASANSRVLHDAWCLARISQLRKDPTMIPQARELAATLITINGRAEAEKLMDSQ
jgi:hypothetical protein